MLSGEERWTGIPIHYVFCMLQEDVGSKKLSRPISYALRVRWNLNQVCLYYLYYIMLSSILCDSCLHSILKKHLGISFQIRMLCLQIWNYLDVVYLDVINKVFYPVTQQMFACSCVALLDNFFTMFFWCLYHFFSWIPELNFRRTITR